MTSAAVRNVTGIFLICSPICSLSEELDVVAIQARIAEVLLHVLLLTPELRAREESLHGDAALQDVEPLLAVELAEEAMPSGEAA